MHRGQARALQVLVPQEELPSWNRRKQPAPAKPQRALAALKPQAPPSNLYVLTVWLSSGPMSEKYFGKSISRTIEIRGDQTLDDLHEAIFDSFEREDAHLYQFQFGKKPFDRKGPNYGISESPDEEGDARDTKLDDLGLKNDRVFGYWFDFGDDWFHQVVVEKVQQAIPTVKYPRIIKKRGAAPPQYMDE